MRGLEQIPWIYDPLCALVERGGLGRWRSWLAGGARGRTLDLGCGTGRNLPMVPPEAVAVGLDPSWHALIRARRRAPHAALVMGTAEALPFRDGAFDTVLSGLAFCSVPDPRAGLREVRRVLRPHGRLRMLEHVRSTRPWKARVQDFIQPGWTALSGGCHPNRDTEQAVVAGGFEIETASRRARGEMRRFSARPGPGGATVTVGRHPAGAP